MSSAWVVRLVQDDQTPILINISRKEGGHDLDLDLLATDGEGAFTTKVRQRSLKKQQAKNYDGSESDWTNIVSSVLDPTTVLSAHSQPKHNLDVTCSIRGKASKRTLSIVFSNKVEEITQRLGTIDLSETEDTDNVDLFGWTAQAIEQRDAAQGEVVKLRQQLQTKDEIVSSLQKQLDELVEAKAEHEQQMLSKFTLLLNQKKLKIRVMQRILTTARPDWKKVEELQAAIGNEPATLPVRNKRAASDGAQDDDQNDSDAFEAMDVDPSTNPQEDPDSPASGNTTPTASEAEDSEEDNTGHTPAAPPPKQPKKNAAAQSKSPAPKSEPATAIDDDETASEDSLEL